MALARAPLVSGAQGANTEAPVGGRWVPLGPAVCGTGSEGFRVKHHLRVLGRLSGGPRLSSKIYCFCFLPKILEMESNLKASGFVNNPFFWNEYARNPDTV